MVSVYITCIDAFDFKWWQSTVFLQEWNRFENLPHKANQNNRYTGISVCDLLEMQPARASMYLAAFHLCLPGIRPSGRSDWIGLRAPFVKAISLYSSVNVFLSDVSCKITSYQALSQIYFLLHWLRARIFKTEYLLLNVIIFLCYLLPVLIELHECIFIEAWCCTKSFAVLSCICHMKLYKSVLPCHEWSFLLDCCRHIKIAMCNNL